MSLRSRELRVLEAKRAQEALERSPPRQARPAPKGWDPRSLRVEVEGEFRGHGARVWREEEGSP